MSSPTRISPVQKATENIPKLADFQFMIGFLTKVIALCKQAKGAILATNIKTTEQNINQFA
jgi:hypothetical protein